jgi:outer membrane lipoprotein-sorting protein
MLGTKHKLSSPLATLFLALTVILTGAEASSADAQVKPLISSFTSLSQFSGVGKTVDGTELISDWASAANDLKAYTYTYEMTVFKGKKSIFEKGNFYFEKPRLLRVEEVGEYKKGAVAVIGKDGKIRGHLGGALSPFTVTLSESSDQLLSANGYPMVDSDYASMSKVTQSFLKQGMKSRVTDRPVQADGHPEKVYILEIYNGSTLFKRAYINAQTLLPVEWFDYQDGRLFARTVWKNLRVSANLSDDLFKL